MRLHIETAISVRTIDNAQTLNKLFGFCSQQQEFKKTNDADEDDEDENTDFILL